MTSLDLPYPVSANRYWRNQRGRMVRSDEARAYRHQVLRAAIAVGMQPIVGAPVAVELVLMPRATKTGRASKTRLDLDNCIKVVLDALNQIGYTDDRQVVRLVAELGQPTEGGGLAVKVSPQC